MLDHGKYLGRYNFAWNSGVLFGFLSGAITLFFISEIQIIFYITPILYVSNSIISIFFFQEPVKTKSNPISGFEPDKNEIQKEKKNEVKRLIKPEISHFTKYYLKHHLLEQYFLFTAGF